MNNTKGFAPIVLIIVILLAAGGVGFYLIKNGLVDPALLKVKPTPSPAEVNLGQVKVTITKKGFISETIIIKKGQSVEWVNEDSENHQVAPDPHPSHTSLPALGETDPIAPNESMVFTFENTGKFAYHDHLNPLKYKGIVIVD